MQNQNTEYKIYVLFEERYPDNIRYVGATIQALNRRLKVHIKDSKRINQETKKHRDKSHKAKWIRKCIRNNVSIGIKQIDSSPFYDEALEIKWIKEYRKMGYDLTNISDGGKAFMLGKHHSDESKQKIRYAREGTKVPKNIVKKTAGGNNGWATPALQYTKCGDFVKRFDCIRDACKVFNISLTPGLISMCCTKNKNQLYNQDKGEGNLYTSQGFVWIYETDKISQEHLDILRKSAMISTMNGEKDE